MKNNLFGRLVDSIMLGLEEKERWDFFQIIWEFMVDEHGEDTPSWEEFAVKNNIGFKAVEAEDREKASIFWKVSEGGLIHELPEGATIYIKDTTGRTVKVSRS